jgi:hypothetical protein
MGTLIATGAQAHRHGKASHVAYSGMSLNICVRLQKQLHDGDNAAFRSINERCVADLQTRKNSPKRVTAVDRLCLLG